MSQVVKLGGGDLSLRGGKSQGSHSLYETLVGLNIDKTKLAHLF